MMICKRAAYFTDSEIIKYPKKSFFVVYVGTYKCNETIKI